MRSGDFQLLGGHLALDLVNTVDWRWDAARRKDLVESFDDLLAWATQAGVVTADQARGFSAMAVRNRSLAERTLRRLRRLRETLGRIFEAAADDARPTARDLRLFNGFLRFALRRRCLASKGTHLEWSWSASSRPALDMLLAPLVLAAAELLTSPLRTKIRACAADSCGWLFLDTSRTGRRRWCSMQGCGNRAKVRRFYAKATSDADR